MHAFAVVRSAMRAQGRVDLPGAVQTVLQRPYDRFVHDDRRVEPVDQIDRVSGAMLASIASHPERLARLPRNAPARLRHVARPLGGVVPFEVAIDRPRSTTDTTENRYVRTVLALAAEVCELVERRWASAAAPGLAACAREAREFSSMLRRWQRHPVLDGLASLTSTPVHSTVLRARPGYREVSAFGRDLLGRTRMPPTETFAALLELRDAALLYEIWCYFQVVDVIAAIAGRPPRLDAFEVTATSAKMRWGYEARWDGLSATYNARFPVVKTGAAQHGRHSYSLPLRPDIVLRADDGQLDVLDAKLKVTFSSGALSSGDVVGESSVTSFVPADVHKMHAYRDALGARSAWALFPGEDGGAFASPWTSSDGFTGVGAISLRPGGPSGQLIQLLRDRLKLHTGSGDTRDETST